MCDYTQANKLVKKLVSVYLVDDRDDCQLSLKGQVEVGHRLCLNPLRMTTQLL